MSWVEIAPGVQMVAVEGDPALHHPLELERSDRLLWMLIEVAKLRVYPSSAPYTHRFDQIRPSRSSRAR